MAKNKKSKSKKRKSGKRKGKRSYRRGRGGRRFVAKPSKRVLYVAAAILGVEVITESIIPDTLPDFVSEDALGVWVAGYILRSQDVQEVAYALEVIHLAREHGLVDTVKEKLSDVTGGMFSDTTRGGAQAQTDYSDLLKTLTPGDVANLPDGTPDYSQWGGSGD